MTDYKPLSDYGLIGNLETCALVGRDGSIDWCCLPNINSSSIFAAILDTDRGGCFAIRPVRSFEADQQYLERTNVLQTTFHTNSGSATVTDFMPMFEKWGADEPKIRALYRKVTCTDGTVDLDVTFEPRFDYARAKTTVEPIDDGVVASGNTDRVSLSSPVTLQIDEIDESEARASYPLSAYDTHWFVLQYGIRAPTDRERCEELLDQTVEYWRNWAHSCDGSNCPFVGYGHDTAVRAGLVLRLLMFRETGAISAAPTTSLPEDIGGIRNWDYRFSWLRDGSFTVQALDNLGHTQEAEEYLDRFLDLSRSIDPSEMQPLYGLEQDADFEETELSHLSGYRDSAPVRVGNGAASQLQLGMYGELIGAIYQITQSDREIVTEDWDAIRKIVEYVRETWEEKDAGIWEMRGGPKHFVHSKAMCWVALDRAIDIAEQNDFEAPLDDWRDERETIETTVTERGFDEDQNSFTQAFDDDQLDASVLLLPLYGFPADDPRIEGTIDAIIDRLTTDDGLVYRYENDTLPGNQGAFVLCSFWLVDCLALMGRTEQAREIHENIREYFSPLGLISEEIDPETGRLLGNFPQAFSHIGFVNSVLYLKESEKNNNSL